MNDKCEVNITTRDRVLRAWENSMELVRDFKSYSEEIKDDPYIADMFQILLKMKVCMLQSSEKYCTSIRVNNFILLSVK